MTLYEYLNRNIERLKAETKMGLISTTTIKHYEIYSRFDYYRKTDLSVAMAIIYVCEDHKIDERTMYRIKQRMEEDI